MRDPIADHRAALFSLLYLHADLLIAISLCEVNGQEEVLDFFKAIKSPHRDFFDEEKVLIDDLFEMYNKSKYTSSYGKVLDITEKMIKNENHKHSYFGFILKRYIQDYGMTWGRGEYASPKTTNKTIIEMREKAEDSYSFYCAHGYYKVRGPHIRRKRKPLPRGYGFLNAIRKDEV